MLLMFLAFNIAFPNIKIMAVDDCLVLTLCRRISPFGQADLLCYGAFAVYEYGFMRHAAHIDP